MPTPLTISASQEFLNNAKVFARAAGMNLSKYLKLCALTPNPKIRQCPEAWTMAGSCHVGVAATLEQHDELRRLAKLYMFNLSEYVRACAMNPPEYLEETIALNLEEAVKIQTHLDQQERFKRRRGETREEHTERVRAMLESESVEDAYEKHLKEHGY